MTVEVVTRIACDCDECTVTLSLRADTQRRGSIEQEARERGWWKRDDGAHFCAIHKADHGWTRGQGWCA